MTYFRALPAHRLNNNIDAMIRELVGPTATPHPEGWSPAVDISENDGAFTLAVSLPGIPKEDVTLSFENEQLILEGERKIDENINYLKREVRSGKFRRVFNVNTEINADNITATSQNGILTISLPKAETAKPKTININVK